MENIKVNNKKRHHFAVMMSTIDDPLQCEIWEGVVKFAEKNDIHLTAFSGSYLSADDEYISHYETCFEAINKSDSINGIIVFSGSIAHYIGSDEIADMIAKFGKRVPTVSVSFVTPGSPAVLADNIAGIYVAVEHLIKVHNKRKIAFVMGPAGHPEAEERLIGYKNALADNNIEFDERYVLPGNFSEDGGREAVIEMIDSRGLEFDSISASDDSTAMGIMRELRRRDILVPTHVAVTGFDGIREAETFIPSISTVRQPFVEIGEVSAEVLLKQVNGEKVDEITNVAPVLIARQSCGCMENEFSDIYINYQGLPNANDNLSSYINRKFKEILCNDVPSDVVDSWISTLVSRSVEKPFNADIYLKTLDEILINYNRYSEDYYKWHEAMSVLSKGIEKFSDEVDCVQTVLSTLISAITLVHEINMRHEKNVEYADDEFHITLRRIASIIVSIFDVDHLTELLHEFLPQLSVNSALIGLYHEHVTTNTVNSDRSIEKVIGFDAETRISAEDANLANVLYSDYSLIPDFNFEKERRTLFFFPLFFEHEEMGILLLPYNPDISIDVYETLRINIATAIRGAELLNKIRALSVTDELTGLYNRRGFFQLTSSKLQFLARNPESIPALLMMDMDGLKHINDTLGHKEGDIAISAFAQVLKQTLRKGDIIGRLGGDEFVVFSSVKSQQDGEYLVQRIRESLDNYNDKSLHPYKLSTCIGCVMLEEATKECFEAAMLSADDVLYEEKAEKRAKGIARK